MTRIGSDAFSGCSGLVSIVIGNGVNRISHLVFYGCKELKDVYCMAEQVPIAEYDIFNNSNIESATLHVPESSIESYRAEKPWNEFKNIIVIDEQSGVQSTTFDNNTISPIYDLNGKRLKMPTKGINIVGCKKFVVK